MLFGALSVACVRQPLTCPDKGGPPWRELASPHFLLRTDHSESDARSALNDLERRYDALERIAFPRLSKEKPQRIAFVLFERDKDYRELAPADTAGYWEARLPNDLETERTMVARGQLEQTTRHTLAHELTHDFARRAFDADLPVWLNEGLAEYYGSMWIDGDSVQTGLATWAFSRPVNRLVSPWTRGSLAITGVHAAWWLIKADAAAFTVDENPNAAQRLERSFNYAGAWALVAMFQNPKYPYRERFADYVKAIQLGRPNEAAFGQAFKGVTWAQINHDFQNYMGSQESYVIKHDLPALGDVKPDWERTLADEEVHLLWARLASWTGKTPQSQTALRELGEAYTKAPGSAEVLYWLGVSHQREGHVDDARHAYRAALAQKPQEARYLYALLQLDGPGQGKDADRADLVTTLTDVATSAEQLAGLAKEHLVDHRVDLAVSFAERAVRARSSCADCLRTLARGLRERGDLDAAILALRRAVAVTPEGVGEEALKKELKVYVAERVKHRRQP